MKELNNNNLEIQHATSNNSRKSLGEIAYPNPFNSMTKLSFKLNEESMVRVNIFDISGRLVETLTERDYTVGSHIIHWNADGFPSGDYVIRLQSGSITTSKSLKLVK